MSETSANAMERRPANLDALQQALRNLKTKAKRSLSSGEDRPKNIQEPMLVIRGK
jgi:hypothetical protein